MFDPEAGIILPVGGEASGYRPELRPMVGTVGSSGSVRSLRRMRCVRSAT